METYSATRQIELELINQSLNQIIKQTSKQTFSVTLTIRITVKIMGGTFGFLRTWWRWWWKTCFLLNFLFNLNRIGTRLLELICVRSQRLRLPLIFTLVITYKIMASYLLLFCFPNEVNHTTTKTATECKGNGHNYWPKYWPNTIVLPITIFVNKTIIGTPTRTPIARDIVLCLIFHFLEFFLVLFYNLEGE